MARGAAGDNLGQWGGWGCSAVRWACGHAQKGKGMPLHTGRFLKVSTATTGAQHDLLAKPHITIIAEAAKTRSVLLAGS